MSAVEPWYWIGRAGLTLEEGRALISEARKEASDIHQMGALGKVPIPGTGKVLVYDGGIDGWDAKIYVEDE